MSSTRQLIVFIAVVLLVVGTNSEEVVEFCTGASLVLKCTPGTHIRVQQILLGDSKCYTTIIGHCCPDRSDCTGETSPEHREIVESSCNERNSCRVDVERRQLHCGGSWSYNDYERVKYECSTGTPSSTTSSTISPVFVVVLTTVLIVVLLIVVLGVVVCMKRKRRAISVTKMATRRDPLPVCTVDGLYDFIDDRRQTPCCTGHDSGIYLHTVDADVDGMKNGHRVLSTTSSTMNPYLMPDVGSNTRSSTDGCLRPDPLYINLACPAVSPGRSEDAEGYVPLRVDGVAAGSAT